MKTKIYLNEWFINAGIIGFIRILEHNNDNFLIIRNNYIEFDTINLSKFHKYYFKYFFDKYNVAFTIEKRLEKSFSKMKFQLENDNIKEFQSIIKSEKKYLSTQLEKIKKIDENEYNEFLNAIKSLEKIKEKEEIDKLDEIFNILINISKKEKINKRITLNLFKNILSTQYFGQPRIFECS